MSAFVIPKKNSKITLPSPRDSVDNAPGVIIAKVGSSIFVSFSRDSQETSSEMEKDQDPNSQGIPGSTETQEDSPPYAIDLLSLNSSSSQNQGGLNGSYCSQLLPPNEIVGYSNNDVIELKDITVNDYYQPGLNIGILIDAFEHEAHYNSSSTKEAIKWTSDLSIPQNQQESESPIGNAKDDFRESLGAYGSDANYLENRGLVPEFMTPVTAQDIGNASLEMWGQPPKTSEDFFNQGYWITEDNFMDFAEMDRMDMGEGIGNVAETYANLQNNFSNGVEYRQYVSGQVSNEMMQYGASTAGTETLKLTDISSAGYTAATTATYASAASLFRSSGF